MPNLFLLLSTTCNLSAKAGFFSLAYNLILNKYYTNLNDTYKTAGQIDLSYEIIEKERMDKFKDKYFIIVGRNKEDVYFKGGYSENYKEKRLVIFPSIEESKDKSSSKDSIGIIAEKQSNIIEIKTNNNDALKALESLGLFGLLPVFDSSNFSFTGNNGTNSNCNINAGTDNSNGNTNQNNTNNIPTLNFREKIIHFYSKYILRKKVYTANKGIIKDQRLLVLGKIDFNTHKNANTNTNDFVITIQPKFLICSGLTEYEEIIGYLIKQQSNRMYWILVFIAFITILDGANKSISKIYKC